MKAVLQNKRRASAPLCVCLLLAALLLTFPFLPASAAEPEGEAAEGAQEELLGNIEEMLGGLDTDALQSYLDSLTEARGLRRQRDGQDTCGDQRRLRRRL